MALPSDQSPMDYDKFEERTKHLLRAASPPPQGNETAESDFAAVGGQFGERRESYPVHIDISEPEDITRRSRSPSHTATAYNESPSVGNSPSLSSPASTPTPDQHQLGPYIQPTDLHLAHRRKKRKHPTSSGTQSPGSMNVATRGQANSNATSVDPGEDNEDGTRGRSTTPRGYFSPSHTPSQGTAETEEEHGEGREPLSPNPYSSYYTYNPSPSREAIDNFEQSFRSEK